MSRKQRADEWTREPLTPAPATSLLAHILARPYASGNRACLGSFDDLAVSLCALCTSVHQPGCSTGCSTCGVVDSCWGSGFRRRPGDDRGGRSSGSGAFPIAHIDPVPQDVGVPHQAWGCAEERAPCGFETAFYAEDPVYGVPRIPYFHALG